MRSATGPEGPGGALTMVCLCAAWCRTCESFRAEFEALGHGTPRVALLRWVDIEDETDAVGDLDIQDFPTLLLVKGRSVLFFGPVLPRVGLVLQLIERAGDGALQPLEHPQAELLAHALGAAS